MSVPLWLFLIADIFPYGLIEDAFILPDDHKQNRGIFVLTLVFL